MSKRLKIAPNLQTAGKPLGPYYFDFTELRSPTPTFDADGVLTLPYPPPMFTQHHPSAIAEYALDCHRWFLETNDDHFKTRFLQNAQWFADSLRQASGGFWLWPIHIKLIKYNVSNPHYSAMVHGYGISVLLRAHELTNDETFLTLALKALDAFECDVSDGGFRTTLNGHTFYEEVPSTPPSFILNGYIFCLMALYDSYRYQGTDQAKTLFDQAVDCLETNLPLYDVGYWSRYNLHYDRYLASRYYHDVHITQLQVVYDITKRETFLKYAERWRSFGSNPLNITRHYFDFHYYRWKYKFQRMKYHISNI